MGKSKKNEAFDPHNLSAQDQLKFEIAQELGLDAKVIERMEEPDSQGKRQDRRPYHKAQTELKKEALQQE